MALLPKIAHKIDYLHAYAPMTTTLLLRLVSPFPKQCCHPGTDIRPLGPALKIAYAWAESIGAGLAMKRREFIGGVAAEISLRATSGAHFLTLRRGRRSLA
jgi:hypothetical protein